MGPLRAYRGEDVTLYLPGNMTVFDIEWFSIYDTRYKENFGSISIRGELNVPLARVRVIVSINKNSFYCETSFKGRLFFSDKFWLFGRFLIFYVYKTTNLCLRDTTMKGDNVWISDRNSTFFKLISPFFWNLLLSNWNRELEHNSKVNWEGYY